jgi:hypothetical protein
MPINSTRGAASAKAFGFTAAGAAPIDVDYLVVASGGGGGGSNYGLASNTRGAAGGGAGGYRTSFPGGTKLTLAKGTTPVTVGAGGTAGSGAPGGNGNNSIFNTITSTAGGGGTGSPLSAGPELDGRPGGSGGATSVTRASERIPGTGNTPPTSPPQGNPGGAPRPDGDYLAGGGGGGSGGPGDSNQYDVSPSVVNGGFGGAATSNSITGVSVSYAEGGLGGGWNQLTPNKNGAPRGYGSAGRGGSTGPTPQPSMSGETGGTGADGVVILRAPGAAGPRISVSPGTNTKTTSPAPDGAATILTFTVNGSITVT